MCTTKGSWQFEPELKCGNQLKMCNISDFKKFGVYPLNRIFLTIVKPGTELKVACIGGDDLSEHMAKCNNDGSWTFDPELKCKDTPVGCKYEELYKKHGVQLRGRPKDRYAKPGDKVQVQCTNAATDDPFYTAMCTKEGAWSFEPELKCEKVCNIYDFKKYAVKPLEKLLMLTVKPGDEVKVTCMFNDSDAIPVYTALCNKDGTWTFDPELKCKDTAPVGCSSAALMKNRMQPAGVEFKKYFDENERLKVTCMDGYSTDIDSDSFGATCMKKSAERFGKPVSFYYWEIDDDIKCKPDPTEGCNVRKLLELKMKPNPDGTLVPQKPPQPTKKPTTKPTIGPKPTLRPRDGQRFCGSTASATAKEKNRTARTQPQNVRPHARNRQIPNRTHATAKFPTARTQPQILRFT